VALPGGLSPIGAAVCAAVAGIEGGPLIVALSGGADSAVAAWACSVARPEGTVRAIHINHGWQASVELESAAEDVAEYVGLPLEVITVTPAPGASREGAARTARLDALVTATSGELIVMGHHADDAAETVVGNLLRGAGATGLSGISPERHPFVRPLLELRRSELRRLAAELGLPFFDDPTNQDTTIRRNLIRHEIIPHLDKHLDGELVEVVGRSARHLAEEDAFLDTVAPPGVVSKDGDVTRLAIAPLVTTSAVLAKRAIRSALRVVHPPYPGTSHEVDAVLAVTMGTVARRDLGEGYVAEREGPFVALYRPDQPVIPEPIELAVPGRVRFGAHLIRANPAPSGQTVRMSHDWCRLALPRAPIIVRAVETGDRIDIGTGSKKASDALGEAGIPLRKRPAWPVIESRGRIAWIAGVRVAAWARVESPLNTWVELERQMT
jgi:tRNA(Ile)-lysidine synthase